MTKSTKASAPLDMSSLLAATMCCDCTVIQSYQQSTECENCDGSDLTPVYVPVAAAERMKLRGNQSVFRKLP